VTHSEVAIARRGVTPETTIPELVRQLGGDSKQLLTDEVRLAKFEMHEAAHEAGAAAMLIAVAFGAGVVAAIAVTLFVATLIGHVVSGHMWLGALVAGVLDVGVGALLVTRGLAAFAEPSRALEEFRAARR
jgi:Putative Actinobacterial Holin-X, holin superfamily III